MLLPTLIVYYIKIQGIDNFDKNFFRGSVFFKNIWFKVRRNTELLVLHLFDRAVFHLNSVEIEVTIYVTPSVENSFIKQDNNYFTYLCFNLFLNSG